MAPEFLALVGAVLEWWEVHQYDVTCEGVEEYNVYHEPPKFVQLALDARARLQSALPTPAKA